MLMKRRRDWFPIVATDLFCGVLCAVIILDAVSPKEIGSPGRTLLIDIAFPDKANLGQAYANRCADDLGRVVFSFLDNGNPISTIAGGDTQGVMTGDTCHLQAFFPSVHYEKALDNPSITIAEYADALGGFEAIVTAPGLETLICTANGSCRPR
jgi:hypothetical protein